MPKVSPQTQALRKYFGWPKVFKNRLGFPRKSIIEDIYQAKGILVSSDQVDRVKWWIRQQLAKQEDRLPDPEPEEDASKDAGSEAQLSMQIVSPTPHPANGPHPWEPQEQPDDLEPPLLGPNDKEVVKRLKKEAKQKGESYTASVQQANTEAERKKRIKTDQQIVVCLNACVDTDKLMRLLSDDDFTEMYKYIASGEITFDVKGEQFVAGDKYVQYL